MEKNKSLLTLSVSHHIHLTSEERHKLAAGDPVITVGVSLPVWYSKGNTNEPAQEVFCHYTLYNVKNNECKVYFKMDGYEMNIPQLVEGCTRPQEIREEEWSYMEPEEQEEIFKEYYLPLSGKCLLDPVEGGSKNLSFTIYDQAKMRGVPTTIHHSVKISDISELENSLIM